MCMRMTVDKWIQYCGREKSNKIWNKPSKEFWRHQQLSPIPSVQSNVSKVKMGLSKVQVEKFQSNNLLRQSFKSIHFVSLVFGISYFSGNSSIWWRILNIIYTLVVFTVLIGFFFYHISSVPPMLCQSNAVAHSVIGIQQILGTIVVAFIYYQVLFHKTQFQNLLKLIAKTETEFLPFNTKFSYKRFAYLILFQVILVTVLLYASFIFFAVYYELPHFEAILLELFTCINPLLVIIINLMTFANLALLIRNRFQILRRHLIDACAIDSLAADDANDVLKLKFNQEAPCDFYGELKKIAQIYENLFSMVHHLNIIFGFSNLASMGELTLSHRFSPSCLHHSNGIFIFRFITSEFFFSSI